MLHPQARALLDMIEQRQIPPTHTLSVADARAYYRDRRAVTQPAPPEVAQVRDLLADGPHGTIPLRSYRPRGSADGAVLPVLVYYHGGGWTIGDLDTHDTLCRELANGAGCAVVAVDYRMGPEHRFPAAVDDCIAATHWVRRHAAELHLDPKRVAVGGDSAGGNLAAVVALAARDSGDLAVAFQLLIYPATDAHRRRTVHALREVADRDDPEQRDRDEPDEHAPRAQGTEHEDALGDQPDHEGERSGDPEVERDPVPAGERGAGEKTDADSDHRCEAAEPEDRVRESESRPLRGVEVLAALNEHADIAVQRGARMRQGGELVDRQLEGRPPPGCAGDEEEDAQDPRAAGCGHGIGHAPIMATREWGYADNRPGMR